MKVEPIRVPLTFENIPAKEWEEQDEGGARPIEEVAAELEKLLEDGDDLIGVCGWPDGGFLNVLVVRGSMWLACRTFGCSAGRMMEPLRRWTRL